MGYHFEKINCFADAEKRYNDTKPMVSKRHTREQDVRPIGDRGRKSERIIKISNTCYALSCGGQADPAFLWGVHTPELLAQYPLTLEEIARLSPIVWRKHEDGTETITIRNGAGEHAHNAIYSFIARALPAKLWFQQTNTGKQFVFNSSQSEAVHIPKTTSAPLYLMEYWKGEMQKSSPSHWAKRYAAAATEGDDGLSVTFTLEQNGRFTLVGKAPKVMVDRTRVNKDVKSEYKDDIKQLFSDAMTFYPMMKSQLNWNFRVETQREAERIARDHGIVIIGFGSFFAQAGSELIRAILKDTAHPLRHSLNIAAMFEINGILDSFPVRDYPDLDEEELAKKQNSLFRAAFTRWINEIGGFTVTTREEK